MFQQVQNVCPNVRNTLLRGSLSSGFISLICRFRLNPKSRRSDPKACRSVIRNLPYA